MTADSKSTGPIELGGAHVQKGQKKAGLQIKTTQKPSTNSIKHTELTNVATEVSNYGVAPILLEKQETSGPEIPASVESFLDPTSPDFNVYEWAKMVMCAADKANVKFRRASFAFKALNVSGSGAASTFQANVASIFMAPFRLSEYVTLGKRPERKILYNLEGLTESGQMLLVLGRPGSGCSTFLKTVAGELHGLKIGPESNIQYNGIPQKDMINNFKGEIVYNAEVDNHFPHLTVKQSLDFAAALRTPQNRLLSTSRTNNMNIVIKVVLAVCGLRHAQNTKVGNDFVRGVSGGERKRVSIAEMLLASASIGCWDNSTRGLDAATALEFVRTLRTSSDILGTTHAVAIYQASQAIYDVFDKVIVFYEGREIYFGPTMTAKAYFEDMGWYCPPRQTTGDFLASVTSPQERKVRTGYEARVPRTPSDFEKHWLASGARRTLLQELEQHDRTVLEKGAASDFISSRNAMQSKHIRSKSPYTVSIPMQLKICIKRAYQRIWNDKPSTFTVVIGQIIMALVVGSVFFGITKNTNSFFPTGSTLFFAVLLNALIAVTEINNLYQQRPIVEKQASYALCHPFVEALAGIIADAPVKMTIAIFFNVILYFLAGLRPEAAQFFIFFLFTVLVRYTMSALFRTVGAATKTISQALAMAGVLVLAMVIYTGYTIPRPYMHPWFKWLSYINPLAYAFEALLVNEMHGRNYPCASVVPPYSDPSSGSFICPVAGAVSGQMTVSGDAYFSASFQYSYSHIWRNLGILIAFWVFFIILYSVTTELNSHTSSSADVLLFRRGHPAETAQENVGYTHDKKGQPDIQTADSKYTGSQNPSSDFLQPQKSVFTWRNVVYDIELKDGRRRLLDNVSGWVRPGTLTVLMGVSGAGKTTLLDVLAQRISTGVITGDMLVNGKPLGSSFQRTTGYVQQQDLHLETSTVREALRFSAMLRQPESVSKAEKYRHVEDVIEMLEMHEFASAIVGVPGGGLNVQQRKLLSIGVELAAKPALLIFLDEPTSGLDSQSSWAIVGFLRRLANNGQAVLATIHQPSSILFQEFDRLLFLARGGRTVYFGDIGDQSKTLLQYFKNAGARVCGDTENPAEYILECVNNAQYDWPDIWKRSEEFQAMLAEQDSIHHDSSTIGQGQIASGGDSLYAMPLYMQLKYTTLRIFQQSWRTPSYIWGKFLLGGVSSLFIGFSFFNPGNSLQGMQNVVFSIFMLTSILSSLVQQIMPRFVMQRSLYEVRERPSKVYSWVAFTIANIVVEIPYQTVLGIFVYACYYYPVYGIESSERQALILLFCIQIFIFASTFAHLVIVVLPDAQTAGAVATLLFAMAMIFNGVFQPPNALPGFWIFMYRVSPLTYIVSGVAATGLHGRNVSCSTSELSVFNPPTGMTCGQYLAPYFSMQAPGQLLNPGASALCQYCPLSTADQFLAVSAISWDTRWRNFGIGWVYVVFNIAVTVALYYLCRVKVWSGWQWGKGPVISAVILWSGFIGAWVRVLLVKGNDDHDSKSGRGEKGGKNVSVRLF